MAHPVTPGHLPMHHKVATQNKLYWLQDIGKTGYSSIS